MTTIWKYLINITDGDQKITTPACAKLIHIGQHNEQIGLWFEVDSNEETVVDNIFRIFGTGHWIKKGPKGRHVGTVIMEPFVWHVYQITL